MFKTTDTQDHLVIDLKENTDNSELLSSVNSNSVPGNLPNNLTALYEWLDQKLSKEEAMLDLLAEKGSDNMPCLRLRNEKSKSNSSVREQEGCHFCSLCKMRKLT